MIAATSRAHLVPFSCLIRDESAKVHCLEGDEQAVVRLQEMGIRPGSTVRMLRPGSPNLVLVDGRRFSLRVDDSIEIYVEPLSD